MTCVIFIYAVCVLQVKLLLVTNVTFAICGAHDMCDICYILCDIHVRPVKNRKAERKRQEEAEKRMLENNKKM